MDVLYIVLLLRGLKFSVGWDGLFGRRAGMLITAAEEVSPLKQPPFLLPRFFFISARTVGVVRPSACMFVRRRQCIYFL